MLDEISTQLREWREAVAANRGLTTDDVDELEDHLLAEYQELVALGLPGDEALLVAKHRLGPVANVAFEYLQAHPDRAWEQLSVVHTGAGWHLPVAIGLGLIAGLAVRVIAVSGFTAGHLRDDVELDRLAVRLEADGRERVITDHEDREDVVTLGATNGGRTIGVTS